jgi:hypothetical protein
MIILIIIIIFSSILILALPSNFNSTQHLHNDNLFITLIYVSPTDTIPIIINVNLIVIGKNSRFGLQIAVQNAKCNTAH